MLQGVIAFAQLAQPFFQLVLILNACAPQDVIVHDCRRT